MLAEIEQAFQAAASLVALAVDLASILVVAWGAGQAIIASAWHALHRPHYETDRTIWVKFASWILLSLEFALGADIIRTAISPTWDDIGKLAAIAGIRTFLNYFLAHDLEEAAMLKRRAAKA